MNAAFVASLGARFLDRHLCPPIPSGLPWSPSACCGIAGATEPERGHPGAQLRMVRSVDGGVGQPLPRKLEQCPFGVGSRGFGSEKSRLRRRDCPLVIADSCCSVPQELSANVGKLERPELSLEEREHAGDPFRERYVGISPVFCLDRVRGPGRRDGTCGGETHNGEC